MIKHKLKGSYNTKQSYLDHILFYNEAKRNKMNYATISTCKNCVIGYRLIEEFALRIIQSYPLFCGI